ncbi:hypothetical protein ACHAQA_007839 [Verticillium albo-atrum]
MADRGRKASDAARGSRGTSYEEHSRHGSFRQTRSRSPSRYSVNYNYRDRFSQQQQPLRYENRLQRTWPLLNDIGSLFRVDLEQRDPDRAARSFRIVPTTHDGGSRINTIGQTLNGATKVAIIHNRASLMAWADRAAVSLEERGYGGELTIISTLGNLEKEKGKKAIVEHWDGSGLFCPPLTAPSQPIAHTPRREPIIHTPAPLPPLPPHQPSAARSDKYVTATSPIPAPSWQLCSNCSGIGHYPADCVVPRPSGFTHVCPLCGSTSHLVDECARWRDQTIWQRIDILVRNRAGKPPLATARMSWPNMVFDTSDRSRFNAPSDWVEITEYPLSNRTVQTIIGLPDCPRTVWLSHNHFSSYLEQIGARSTFTPKFLAQHQPAATEQVYKVERI